MPLRHFLIAVAFTLSGVTGVGKVSATETAITLTTVPEFRGLRPGLARQMARLVGVESRTGMFYIDPDNWQPAMRSDRVSMQTPQGKSSVADGATVACWVFARATRDTPVVSTPDVCGLSIDEAQVQLDAIGLQRLDGSSLSQQSDDAATEVVLEQYPRAGQKVFAGTSVYLRLRNQQRSEPSPAAPAINETDLSLEDRPIHSQATIAPGLFTSVPPAAWFSLIAATVVSLFIGTIYRNRKTA